MVTSALVAIKQASQLEPPSLIDYFTCAKMRNRAMAAYSWHSSIIMALLASIMTSVMVLADHLPDGSHDTTFVGEQHHVDPSHFNPPGPLIQPDHEPRHTFAPLREDSHSETHSVVHVSRPPLHEPGNSIPKIINRPGTPEDFSFFKLKDVPEHPQSNGPSSYQEYIPVLPITNAILNFTNDATTERSASLSANYDATAQVSIPLNPSYDVAPGAIFFPQDPQQTHSSYSEVPANSYPIEQPSEGVQGGEPFSGFLATWWKSGSFLDAAAGQTNHIWKSFTKSVGTKAAKKWKGFTKGIGKKVAKKSKKILIKAAPIVKKVIGVKAVASLFQSAGISKAEVGGVGTPGVPTVVGHQAPLTTYGAPLTETRPVEPEVIKTSHSAPTQAAQPTYGVPPQAPQPTYGAPPQIIQPLVLPAHPEQSDEAPFPAQTQIVNVPAQQQGYFTYIPPQASHLFRNQAKKEEQSDDQGESKKTDGVLGIVNGVEVKNNIVYNIYQFGRNLTDQAALSLSSLWPGNWIRSSGEVAQASSSYVEAHYEAPTVESHYSATVPAPLPALAPVPLIAPVVAHSHGTVAYQ